MNVTARSCVRAFGYRSVRGNTIDETDETDTRGNVDEKAVLANVDPVQRISGSGLFTARCVAVQDACIQSTPGGGGQRRKSKRSFTPSLLDRWSLLPVFAV